MCVCELTSLGAGVEGGEWLATVVMVVDELIDKAELRMDEALDNEGLFLSGASPNAGEAVCVCRG